jgi:hypothetical protein
MIWAARQASNACRPIRRSRQVVEKGAASGDRLRQHADRRKHRAHEQLLRRRRQHERAGAVNAAQIDYTRRELPATHPELANVPVLSAPPRSAPASAARTITPMCRPAR